MSFLNRLKASRKFYSSVTRAKYLLLLTALFAVIYHVIYLFVFKSFGIMFMYYYNYFSVTFFSGIFIYVLKCKAIPISVFVIAFIEVLTHQSLCIYCFGYSSGFHYIILLIGLLPFLIYREQVEASIGIGFVCTIIFVFFELYGPNINPAASIDPSNLFALKVSNVIASVLVIFAMNVVFAIVVYFNETNLEVEVDRQTKKLRRQNSQIMGMQNRTINSIANLVESRDLDTGEHVQRTRAYVELLAKNLLKRKLYPDVINERFVQLLGKAAPLHDIGKILVSDSILKKQGKLTEDEFEEMKLHTTEGGRIIREVFGYENDEYINIAAEVALNHHEWWNGKGYPNGSVEDEIPVSARIMAIADVFDALVAQRCYKKAMPFKMAMDIIEKESGTHFDPVMVKVFLEIEDQVYEEMKKPLAELI